MELEYSCEVAIAGLTIAFCTCRKVEWPESFQPFRTDMNPDYKVFFRETTHIPGHISNPVFIRDNILITTGENQNTFVRWFRDPEKKEAPYAYSSIELSSKTVNVFYLRTAEKMLGYLDSCFSYIAWETLLMHEKRLLLHSSFVASPYGGILFSGVSGIGKSTQADLWCRFRGCRLLNGDRTILHFEDNRLTGYGSPYAGSSKCYVNDSCTIRILVFLQKSTECRVRKLRKAEAFRNIYAQLTVNSWDKKFVQFACDMAERIADTIPVYELSCTPDLKAVELLEKVLQGGRSIWREIDLKNRFSEP